jgi:predicted ester cyclase
MAGERSNAGSHNMAVVRRAIEEIWNQGRLEVADELFAPDYVNHEGLIPDLIDGPEAIKLSVALYRAAFPDFYLTVDDLHAEGVTVVLRWTAHRTPPHVSRCSPAPAAGTAGRQRPGSLSGTTRSRLAGGQIAESWTEWDRIAVLRQTGLFPLPEALDGPRGGVS